MPNAQAAAAAPTLGALLGGGHAGATPWATDPAARALSAAVARLDADAGAVAIAATPPGLHAKQRVAFETAATEVLYGGAAGGGKSHLMRVAAIAWCTWIPGLQVYLFRREFPDLFKNHLEGPSGFPALLAEVLQDGRARIVWGKNQIRFANGSVIHLCHCQHEKDVYGYQGAEIHVLLIDELTQWTYAMYAFLRARLRLGGLRIPAWLAGRFPRILCGANPGGIGHTWVKGAWIDPGAPLAVVDAPEDEGGMRRQYLPAQLEDNPTMAANDPTYERRLQGIADKALARAMRLGDWDIVAGGYFDDVWDRAVHVVPPFAVPASWRLDRSFDWGAAKPFSVGWWAECDGTPAALPDGRGGTRPWHPARGTLVRVAEWYGWNGKPNEGCRLTSDRIAAGIVERERGPAALAALRGRAVRPGPADSSIFDADDGQSVADKMAAAGVRWLPADKRPGTRKIGWDAMRRRLLAARERPREEAGLYVVNTCPHFIRTVPVLPRDERNPEDVDTRAEDHVADESRYRVLAAPRGPLQVGRRTT